MKKVMVCVTKEDINNGICRRPNSCPIALAVKRATGIYDVWVSSGYIRVGRDSKWTGLSKRDKAKIGRFVLSFDSCEVVRPFRFYLPL